MQDSPAAHARPHRPQLSWLVPVLTQTPLHSVSPVGQELVQVPSEQAWLAEQALPQRPQFEASTLVSTHSPEQSVRPEGQVQPPLQV